VPVWLPGIHDATKLSVGDAHACVIVGPQNELWCWGDNTFVQLGDSRIKGSTASPIPFLRDGAALTGVTAFAAGRNSTCAVVEAGQVVCSGDSTDGVLGDDVGPEPAASVLVLRGAAFLTDALQIGIGLTHACIVNAMHGVECWGGNRAGQLGQGHKDPASPGAHAVRGLASGVDAIAVGSNHACALASGKVYCWGSNSYGELGTRDSSAANDEPSEVTGIDDATSVSAGVNATCVERRDHSTVCFGNDLYGQIGSTLEVVPSKGPIAPDVGALKHVRTKGYHACGIRQDGAAICWGKNASGELGLGTKSAAPVVSLSPVQPVRYVGR
jgi:alpha-tubulin suppressor-like RCC1 family protein